MSENPEIATNNQASSDHQQKPLDTVVKNLMKSQSRPKIGMKDGKSYDALYKDISMVLEQLDTTIVDCKKYNEAKIHRKYQIRIADLELEIKILRQKLSQQQNARSPSKKYIQQLVDKLVVYKNNNQNLTTQNQQLKHKIKQLQQRLNANINEMASPLSLSPKQKTSGIKFSARQTTNITNAQPEFNLKLEVSSYLTQQQNLRRITEESKSKFQYFLKKKLDFMDGWNFLMFLSEIDKWHTAYCNHNEQKLSQRLKSNYLSTLEDEKSQKKLPKIFPPYSMSTVLPVIPFSQQRKSQLNKMYKRRDINKSKKNYSTMEVASRARSKYILK